MELKVLEEQRARPHTCSPDSLQVLQTPQANSSQTQGVLAHPNRSVSLERASPLQPSTYNDAYSPLSHHFSSRVTTWGATVLDRPKGVLAHLLRPNATQSPNTTFGNITCGTPFPAKGVHEASETGSSEPQRLFARSRNNLSSGYISHDFVTAIAWCAITTALQPSTSIYMGLVAIPKVESSSPLNHHSLISTDLSVGVSAGTPPDVPRVFLTHSTTIQTTTIKSSAVTF